MHNKWGLLEQCEDVWLHIGEWTAAVWPLNAFEYFNIMGKFGEISYKINILSVEIQKHLIVMWKLQTM